jgi:hypothetical protein
MPCACTSGCHAPQACKPPPAARRQTDSPPGGWLRPRCCPAARPRASRRVLALRCWLCRMSSRLLIPLPSPSPRPLLARTGVPRSPDPWFLLVFGTMARVGQISRKRETTKTRKPEINCRSGDDRQEFQDLRTRPIQTSLFHGGNRGSNPLGDANNIIVLVRPYVIGAKV